MSPANGLSNLKEGCAVTNKRVAFKKLRKNAIFTWEGERMLFYLESLAQDCLEVQINLQAHVGIFISSFLDFGSEFF